MAGSHNIAGALRALITAMLLLLGLGAPMLSVAQVQRFSFSGGPDNSALQFFAHGLAEFLSRHIETAEFSYTASAGAIENLDRIGNGSADFSIVYAGDLYHSMYRHGQGAASPYRNVQPLASLFALQAHLMVRNDTDIRTVDALAGRQVAVGPAGSASAAVAQQLFESLQLWHQLTPRFMTPEDGVAALAQGGVDALWVFAAVPSTAVIHAAAGSGVRMLDIAPPSSALMRNHPYYTRAIIPGGTYPGVNHNVLTFAESALWVAGAHVSPDLTYQALTQVYSPDGLGFMRTLTSAAESLSIDHALAGVLTPLHAGAQTFWSEKGVLPIDVSQ